MNSGSDSSETAPPAFAGRHRAPRDSWRRAVVIRRGLILCLVVLSSISSLSDSNLAKWAVGPGHDDLLADMLGRGTTLPGPCRLTACGADGTVVRGTYACPGGEVVFELRHPTGAPADATRTNRFAILVTSGTPPPALANELESRVRSREAGFEWTLLRPPNVRPAWSSFNVQNGLVLATLGLLLAGTLCTLGRQVCAQRPSGYAVLTLVQISLAGLALRLQLSPRTFLHEYEPFGRAPQLLAGLGSDAYGATAPAIFHFVATVLRRPDDVYVIFFTNAVLSALAIPALALFALLLTRRWSYALCAAVLLCVLPLHLRFSAGEDVFVQGVTFSLWALGLFALYLRTNRLDDALLAGLAVSLAIQVRPEMLFLPAVLVLLVVLAQPRSWRRLFAWRTLLACAVVVALQLPRLAGAFTAVHPTLLLILPTWRHYLDWLVIFQPQVTPRVYWLLLLAGLGWGIARKPGVQLWVILVFIGFTLFSSSNGDNTPYNQRTQLVPTSLAILIAAGTGPLWMSLWGRHRRWALVVGGGVLMALALAVVAVSRGFITERRDQQLEWAFLERTVPQLPAAGTLLWAGPEGGEFPQLLLRHAGRAYGVIDARQAARGEADWPAAAADLVYYQGMDCYFVKDQQPWPDPITPFCKAVYERYTMEPILIEDLTTLEYSYPTLHRAGEDPLTFRIGFFRVTSVR